MIDEMEENLVRSEEGVPFFFGLLGGIDENAFHGAVGGGGGG